MNFWGETLHVPVSPQFWPDSMMPREMKEGQSKNHVPHDLFWGSVRAVKNVSCKNRAGVERNPRNGKPCPSTLLAFIRESWEANFQNQTEHQTMAGRLHRKMQPRSDYERGKSQRTTKNLSSVLQQKRTKTVYVVFRKGFKAFTSQAQTSLDTVIRIYIKWSDVQAHVRIVNF